MTYPDVFVIADDSDNARAIGRAAYERLKSELTAWLPSSAEFLHIGATAIEGCLTKGDLDVVLRIAPDDFTDTEKFLASRFAYNRGSVRKESFAAFEDAERQPHLGIQLVVKDSPLDVFHVFARALQRDADLVQRYNRLKLAHHNRPMAEYRAAKDIFIAEVLARLD